VPLYVDTKIFNYSFHPVPKNVHKMGVVDLSDNVNQMLRSLIEFDVIPTRQEISERCRAIVHHAVQSNHKAVFLRNYKSYQSELIHEFHKNGTRVFVPIYNKSAYTEDIVGTDTIHCINYLKIINISEVSNRYQSVVTESSVFLSQNQSTYQLFIEGKLDTGIQVRFNLVEGEISDIITWFQAFTKQIKTATIRDYLISKLGIQYKDINEFTQGLIQILHEFKELNIKTDEISEMIDIIKTASIIDSNHVQEYITLTDYATVTTSNHRERIKLLDKARNYYNSFNDEERDVITILGTNSFKRLGFRRSNKLIFNPAYLYRGLGFLNMQINHWVDAETNLRKSIKLYQQYDDNEINDSELDIPYNNLILSMIVLGKNDLAKEMINQRIESVGDKYYERIIVLNRYLSRINRNEGKYDKALEILFEIQDNINRERKMNDYYTINNQCAIIYYLKGMPEKSFELLSQVVTEDGLSVLVKSYGYYLYNLILSADNKKLNYDVIDNLSKINDNYFTNSYLSLISILAMIKENDTVISIISKLKEYIELFPNKVILGFVILGKIYAENGYWEEFGELIDTMLPISTKYSSSIKIKIYLCKYYLEIILGNYDINIKNIIERLFHEENLDITKYFLGNSIDKAIEEIKGILDMNLVKVDEYIFD
jgi:hypothetical protein